MFDPIEELKLGAIGKRTYSEGGSADDFMLARLGEVVYPEV